MPEEKDVTTLRSEISIMSYRLSTIETKLDESLSSLSSKIDLLLERYGETKERQALDSQALALANQEIVKLETRLLSLEKDVVKVKITIAEKLVYGGIGGGLVAGIIELIQLGFS
jgi:chromosome segregation ATPase